MKILDNSKGITTIELVYSGNYTCPVCGFSPGDGSPDYKNYLAKIEDEAMKNYLDKYICLDCVTWYTDWWVSILKKNEWVLTCKGEA